MIAAFFNKIWEGRVYFTAENGFSELFLESCAARGVTLYGVLKREGQLSAEVRCCDFRRVSDAANKAGMALTVQKRTGLPPLAYRYRARMGIPAGLLLAAALLWVLSGSLWEIHVSGNEWLSREEILDVMDALGVRTGARIASIDVKNVEQQAQEMLPRISWIAVNITGCKATVEVRETQLRNEAQEESGCADIVAAADGVILRADLLAGEGDIREGQEVKEGDLLVSGRVRMNNGETRLTGARAIIEALTRTELSCRIGKTLTAEQPVRRRDVYMIRLFALRIPLGIVAGSDETAVSTRLMRSRRTVFPVGIEREQCVRYETIRRELSDTEAAAVCFASYAETFAERYRDARVLSGRIRILSNRGAAEIRGVYDSVENICRRVPFSPDNPDRKTDKIT